MQLKATVRITNEKLSKQEEVLALADTLFSSWEKKKRGAGSPDRTYVKVTHTMLEGIHQLSELRKELIKMFEWKIDRKGTKAGVPVLDELCSNGIVIAVMEVK